MSNTRSQYSAEFKFKVGMLSLTERQTISEIAGEYEVHPTQISKWKKELQEHGPELFQDKRKKDETQKQQAVEIDRLYKQIGQLTVENDRMKKKSGFLSLGR